MQIREADALPDTAAQPAVWLLGQDGGRHWVALHQSGACGGLFVSKDAALRFILGESSRQLLPIVQAADRLEFGAGPTNGCAGVTNA